MTLHHNKKNTKRGERRFSRTIHTHHHSPPSYYRHLMQSRLPPQRDTRYTQTDTISILEFVNARTKVIRHVPLESSDNTESISVVDSNTLRQAVGLKSRGFLHSPPWSCLIRLPRFKCLPLPVHISTSHWGLCLQCRDIHLLKWTDSFTDLLPTTTRYASSLFGYIEGPNSTLSVDLAKDASS
jgi:hypothetical protein